VRVLLTRAGTGFALVLKLCSRCARAFPPQDLKQSRCAACNREHERERYEREPRRRIRNSVKWQQTREAVKRRDGFACRRCGATEPLEVHHIIRLRFAANPFDLENLETLCVRCHRQENRVA
jgi:5-methylcytosine-specific restriction endonuclease McrA